MLYYIWTSLWLASIVASAQPQVDPYEECQSGPLLFWCFGIKGKDTALSSYAGGCLKNKDCDHFVVAQNASTDSQVEWTLYMNKEPKAGEDRRFMYIMAFYMTSTPFAPNPFHPEGFYYLYPNNCLFVHLLHVISGPNEDYESVVNIQIGNSHIAAEDKAGYIKEATTTTVSLNGVTKVTSKFRSPSQIQYYDKASEEKKAIYFVDLIEMKLFPYIVVYSFEMKEGIVSLLSFASIKEKVPIYRYKPKTDTTVSTSASTSDSVKESGNFYIILGLFLAFVLCFALVAGCVYFNERISRWAKHEATEGLTNTSKTDSGSESGPVFKYVDSTESKSVVTSPSANSELPGRLL